MLDRPKRAEEDKALRLFFRRLPFRDREREKPRVLLMLMLLFMWNLWNIKRNQPTATYQYNKRIRYTNAP